ncbi:MAG: hypothetical protein ACLSAH_10780 [Bilophila wadsworthia]
MGVMVGYDVNATPSPASGSLPRKTGLGTRVADPAFRTVTGKPADARLKSPGRGHRFSGATISSTSVVTALGNTAKVMRRCLKSSRPGGKESYAATRQEFTKGLWTELPPTGAG